MRRLVIELVSVCCLLIAVVAALVIGILSLRAAHSTSSCLQETLQARSGPTEQDQKAHVQFAEALDRLVHLGTLTPAQAAQERADLQKAVDSYVHTLVNDQAYRNGHAFTRC